MNIDMTIDYDKMLEERRMKTMTIEVNRDDEWIQVKPEELTTSELCECLSNIQIETDEFLSQKDIDEGYSASNEAIRRLSSHGRDGKSLLRHRCYLAHLQTMGQPRHRSFC